MKCVNCKSEIVGNNNYCPNCGTYQRKKGLSLITKISLVLLIVLATLFFCINIYALIGSRNDEAFGWIFGLNSMTSFLVVPYYVFVFVVSLSLDNKKDIVKKIQSILVPILLLIPIIGIICIISK